MTAPAARGCDPAVSDCDPDPCDPAAGGCGGGDQGPRPEWTCDPGSLEQSDGSCLPAGVPECAPGFEPDGEAGCQPLLPADCPSGQMAVPGDASCREVSDCGAGTWGNIPVEAGTVYVDASYSGGGSNGSAGAPFTSIAAAVTAAPSGGHIAIAQGSYAEDVQIDKPLRIWGRCPSLVEMTGAGGSAVITVAGASNSEVHGLALRDGAVCLLVAKATGVVIDSVRAHGCGDVGLLLQTDYGTGDPPAATAASASNMLIEDIDGPGVVLNGSNLTLSRANIRNVVPTPAFTVGAGVHAVGGSLEASAVVIANASPGVYLEAAQAVIDASVIRDGRNDSSAHPGMAIRADPLSGIPSDLTLRGSVLERNRVLVVALAGSDALVESTVIRDNLPIPGLEVARGLHTEVALGIAPDVDVRGSVIRDTIDIGIALGNATARVESTVVRDVALGMFGEGLSGHGIVVASFPPDNLSPSAVVTGSAVAGIHGLGVASFGGSLDVSTTRTSDTGGPGILYQHDAERGVEANGNVSDCLVEAAGSAGISVGSSTASIRNSVVRGVIPYLDSDGDGVAVISWTLPGRADVDNVFLLDNARVGLASFGASVSLTSGFMLCNPIALNGERFGESMDFDFSFEDLGGSECGCDDTSEACQVLSAGIEPPSFATP